MHGLSAVVFVPDDTAKTGFPTPLLLQRVLGAPLLSWLADSLYYSGIGRFFLVCSDRFAELARDCLPSEAEVMTTMDNNPADLLHVFLSTTEAEEEDITIVAGPVLHAPMLARRSGESIPASVFRAKRELLMDSLEENFVFSRFLKEKCSIMSDYDGFFTIDSPATALDMAVMLRRDRMLKLLKQGVEITDPDSCCIEPGVRIEPGVSILPDTILRGRTILRNGAVVGPWCDITDSEIGQGARVRSSTLAGVRVGAYASVGPYANLRPGCELGADTLVGCFVDMKNAKIGDNSLVSHLAYVGDAQVGSGCNIGCGAATVNFDRVQKHKTVIGDNAFIGCNVSLIAPVAVGDGAYLAAGSVITEDVPENALGIARSGQSIKRDWAAKHKK